MLELINPAQVSLKNILVATDFSQASLSALTCSLPIAKHFNSVIHIVHVTDPPQIDIASPAANSRICPAGSHGCPTTAGDDWTPWLELFHTGHG